MEKKETEIKKKFAERVKLATNIEQVCGAQGIGSKQEFC